MLVGPSGCGKTTAMRMANRMVEITEGDVLIGDRSVRDRAPAELRREIGYVIQQIGLFPHRTIAENIATVPGLLGWDRDRARARAAELLELIGLDAELGDRYPAQLSGGQQQRVGVARALAANPGVMLMDEPFGAVDPINRERLQNEFLRLQAELRKTILFVTHDIDEAIKMGDRIAVLKEGGHLAQYATPAELLMAPADAFVEDFVGADRALKRLSLHAGRRHRPLGGAARVRRPGDRRGSSEARGGRGSRTRCWSTPSAGRWAGSPTPTSRRETVPARPDSATRPDARPRRRHARRALRPASGRDPVRAGGRRRAADRRRALGRDHLRLPLLQQALTDEHPAAERPLASP